MENKFEHIIMNSNSNIKTFTKKPLDQDEIKSLHIPLHLKEQIENQIVKINEKYYHAKMATSKEMLNELIGSFLAKQLNLEAVDYQIGIYEGDLYALSELFYDENHTYPLFEEYFSKTEQNQEALFDNDGLGKPYLIQPKLSKLVKDEQLANKILKLIALDLKMDQVDRHSENVMLRKNIKTGTLDLTPIYDFANSYFAISNYPRDFIYDTPFIIVRKNKLSLRALSRKNPEILKSSKTLIDTPIEDVLSEIEKEKQITIPDKTKAFYKKKDGEYTKVLQKL